jgi:tetratricopeptide (TPR) repeat protein
MSEDHIRMIELEGHLKQTEDRSSDGAKSLAKEYSQRIRTQCAQLFAAGKVNECLAVWQESHKLLFFQDDDTDRDMSYFDEELVMFLIDCANFFSKLASPNKDTNIVLLKKRIQLYTQIFMLCALENLEMKNNEQEFSSVTSSSSSSSSSSSLKELIPGLHRSCGSCHFQLNDFQSAFDELSIHASLIKEKLIPLLYSCVSNEASAAAAENDSVSSPSSSTSPPSSTNATWTCDDCKVCMDYCDAQLEAIECLKVMKKSPEAVEEYLKVLAMMELVEACSSQGDEEQQEQLGPNAIEERMGAVNNNIAMCYYNMFEYEKTLPYFERALVAFERVYGPDVPAINLTRQNIATNRHLASLSAQMAASGVEVKKLDLTTHRQLDPQEEKNKYFSKN